MRLATAIDYSGGFKASAERVADWEKAGLDVVFVAEAYGYDAVSQMGYLAAITDSITIASGILPIYTRTPTLLAQTAAGMDDVSDGRFILGLGASGPQVIEGWHGVPYHAPLGRTREIIDVCRKVWKRERLVHEGKYYNMPLPKGEGTGLGKPLKMITHPKRDDIPIWIASLGPKNVALTAEVANGWQPIFYDPTKAHMVWGDDLAAGNAKRDPSLPPMDVVAGGIVAIGEGSEKVRDMVRPMVALYVGGMGAKGKNFYNDVACRYGYEDAAAKIQDLYLDGHKDDAAAAVPDEFLEGTTICGDEGYVRDRLAAYAEAGVTVLSITPVGDEPVKVIEKLKTLMP